MAQDVAMALVVAGTAVIVASCCAALTARDFYHRLHFATPLTSLGVPLIALGVSVANGAGLTTASVLLPVALLFLAGPSLSAAIARMKLEQSREPSQKGPE
jgi:multisubunit Na+/H+ antiporter MnhG subunit